MVLTNRLALIIVVATASRMVAAFTPQSLVTNIPLSRTRLHVSIERELVSTKEYEQIKGLEYGVKKLETLEEHQARTGYKYPKHVEVIEDFEPVVATMVDKIVSFLYLSILNYESDDNESTEMNLIDMCL